MSSFLKKLLSESRTLESGQAMLIVVLVLVVALTVGLSVVVRTTTNLRSSSESENSERAFSAAEAGIERTLTAGTSIPNTSLTTGTSYETTLTTLAGGEFNLGNGSLILKDEPVDMWLSTYPTYASPWSGSLTVNWGSASDVCSPSEANNSQAALEVIVISGTSGSPSTTTYVLDPCSSRASSNNFEYVSTAGDTIDGRIYAYKKTITVSSGLLVRIIPLYSGSHVGVRKGAADPDFPVQGTVVTSVGTADNTQRKIVSFRGHPQLPAELFPFVYFSPK
jgi:Tfp pilus assembly protein PilX